jgi:hypothetical protein
MEENKQYVYVSLDAYTALVERAVKAECEVEMERSRRWALKEQLDALKGKEGENG